MSLYERLNPTPKTALQIEFNHHLDGLSRLPKLNWNEMFQHLQEEGRAVQTFLTGGSFDTYIETIIRLDEETKIYQRTLCVNNIAELYELLHYWTNDPEYSNDQAKHERLHADQSQKVASLGIQPPDVLFAVIPFSDDIIVPYTIFYRKTPALSPTESHLKDPYKIFKDWGLQGTKTFWRHMIEITDDKSKGDIAILGGEFK